MKWTWIFFLLPSVAWGSGIYNPGSGGGVDSGAVPLETIFGSANSSPTATLKGAVGQFTGAVSGATMTFTLDSTSVTLQGNALRIADMLSQSSATATYLQSSSATATYLQSSSATATYCFANGTNCTASGGGDNLGSHISTKTLTANFGITASSVNFSSNTVLPGTTFYNAGAIRMGGNLGNTSHLFINAGNPTASGASNMIFGTPNATPGSLLTTGNSITCMGDRACNGVVTASAFTGIGYNAAIVSSNSTNVTAVGANALLNATSGNQNTALGAASLSSMQTGANNTALGFDACDNGTTHSGAICIGYQSYVLASNVMSIGGIAVPITDVYMNSPSQTGNVVGSSITFHAQNSSGTNRAGGDFAIAGGSSSGNAAGGRVIIQVSSSSASGTLTNKLISISTFTFPGPIFYRQTSAQLASQNPADVSQMVACSDCTSLNLCMSTGTGRGAWTSPVDKAVVCN